MKEEDFLGVCVVMKHVKLAGLYETLWCYFQALEQVFTGTYFFSPNHINIRKCLKFQLPFKHISCNKANKSNLMDDTFVHQCLQVKKVSLFVFL